MILYRSDALRNARANVHKTLLAGGKIQLYTATMPANGAAITDQTLLAEFTLTDPVGTVDAGAFDLGAVIETMAVGDGAAAWVRISDSTSAWLMDLDVGETGSGAAIIATPLQVYTGGTVRINSFRLIEP